jgi:hypothetical protein
MLLIRIFIFSILLFSSLNDVPKDKSIFISPLKIPLSLSSNFGELRRDHFHSGLDIKTQGVTGKEVVAPADGYIYIISVSPVGFGNSLYIRHPSGYSTVYGHLDKFAPKIEKYVRDYQYRKKSFAVTLLPSENEFPVKQGEIIAYTGNSGGSEGPHLHYEIRKSDSERPVNPQLFDFGVNDNVKPVIDMLAIYPINRHSLINRKNSVRKINVSGSDGKYYITQENEISISGAAGFGIKTFDRMDDGPNKCGVYSIELFIDSVSIYKYVMDGFSFSESRYVNSHIDYETLMKDNIYIERTFILPGDRLSVYKHTVNRGIFSFTDTKVHHAEMIVTDIAGNKSVLKFRIQSREEASKSDSKSIENDFTAMPYNKSNSFSSENISLNIPSGALYDTLDYLFKKEPGTVEMLSDLYYVHNKFTPLHKASALAIKPGKIPSGLASKMLIIQLDDEKKKSAVASKWDGEYLTGNILSFGRFYIGLDTIAPVISAPGMVQGVNLNGRKEIKIKIKDDLSGIKSYEPLIDGQWALFEYDQKNDMLIYTFDETRITKGKKHNLTLLVTDNKDNTGTFKCSFIW